MVFGRKLVITQYSFAQLVRRLHESIEYLNRAIHEHDSAPNPVQKVAAQGKLVRNMIRLQMYEKKLGKAYLNLVNKNIDQASVYMSNNPQFQNHVKYVREQTEKNLKEVVMGETGTGARSNYLIALAKSLVRKANNSAKATENKIKANVAQLQVQQQKKGKQ